MNAGQLKKYRYEWAQTRKAMRALGIPANECEDRRKSMHLRAGAHAGGAPKSSLDLTNAEFSRVLAEFWSWSCPADLNKQAHTVNQVGIQRRWVCEHIMTLTNELDASTYGMHGARAYVDAIFKRLNAGCPQDPDWADEPQWSKVQAALVYRYDQVARAILGKAGHIDPSERAVRKHVQFHPCKHAELMAKLRRHVTSDVTPEPEYAYAGPANDEDPF